MRRLLLLGAVALAVGACEGARLEAGIPPGCAMVELDPDEGSAIGGRQRMCGDRLHNYRLMNGNTGIREGG